MARESRNRIAAVVILNKGGIVVIIVQHQACKTSARRACLVAEMAEGGSRYAETPQRRINRACRNGVEKRSSKRSSVEK